MDGNSRTLDGRLPSQAPMDPDRQAIERIVFTYAQRLDLGDFEGAAALFEHATMRSNVSPVVHQGRDAVLNIWRTTVRTYDGVPCTKHVTTNLMIDIDTVAGTARAQSYFTVLQARPDLPLQVIIAGRYEDKFDNPGSGWRLRERFIFTDLLGDLSRHLKLPLGGR